MAFIDTKKLPKVDFAEKQREAQSKVEANPFANLNLGAMKVEQDPTFGNNRSNNPTQQSVKLQQTSVASIQQPKTVASTNSGVVGQKVTKRTRNGNTYSYADKYDHSKDIKPRRVVPITFRIDADVYETFKARAKRERVSVNQLIIRAMEQFR